MRTTIVAAACLLASATVVSAADREVHVTPLDHDRVRSLDQGLSEAACFEGNQNAAAYAITDFIWGQESYAYVFRATPGNCGCPSGFEVLAAHLYMQVAEADVPLTFHIAARLLDTADGASPSCRIPASTICSTMTFEVSLPAAGLYDLSLPMNSTGCPVAFAGGEYALAFDFPDLFDPATRPNAVTDDTPLGCASYNDWGSGWTDVLGFGFPGELKIFAEIGCRDGKVCSSPAVPIPDDSVLGVTDSLELPGPLPSHLDLNLEIRATHTWVGDLRFELTHEPSATTVTPFDRPGFPALTFGCGGDNVDVSIDDEGMDGEVETTCSGTPAISGELVGGDPPNRALLAGFEDADPSGVWSLRAQDLLFDFTGTLDEWCLVPTPTIIFADGFESGGSSFWSWTVPPI